jgi:1-acyl-sn-glycerol-3-phosphate acyltransferase
VITLGRDNREARTQHLISGVFRMYLRMLRGFGLIRLEVIDGERLARCRGRIVVANHPTLLDVVFLMAFTPRLCCIVKHELWENRYLKGVVRAAGYIRNDLSPDATISACRAALEQGNNLLVFPEGTRSRIGKPMHFYRGFANIALLTGASVQPVAISCNPPTLAKGERWYQVPPRQPRFRLEVGDPIEVERFKAYPHRGVGARRLTDELMEFCAGRLVFG